MPSPDQRQCSLSTVSFAVATAAGPELRSRYQRPQRGEDDLNGGKNASGQLDLSAGGCEVGAVAITEGDRTSPRRHAVIPRRSPTRRWAATVFHLDSAPQRHVCRTAESAVSGGASLDHPSRHPPTSTPGRDPQRVPRCRLTCTDQVFGERKVEHRTWPSTAWRLCGSACDDRFCDGVVRRELPGLGVPECTMCPYRCRR